MYVVVKYSVTPDTTVVGRYSVVEYVAVPIDVVVVVLIIVLFRVTVDRSVVVVVVGCSKGQSPIILGDRLTYPTYHCCCDGRCHWVRL